jgi:hypothetical protein
MFIGRIIGIGIIGLYLINSLILGEPLNFISVLENLILSQSLSDIIKSQVIIITIILIAIVMGLYLGREAKQVPRQYSFRLQGVIYMEYLILGLIFCSLLLDIYVFNVITSDYVISILYYIPAYFLLYTLEFVLWFGIVYNIDLYLHQQLVVRNTKIIIEPQF